MTALSAIAAAPENDVACFFIIAESDPGLLSRALEVFAKRSLIPARVYATCVGPSGDEVQIDLQVHGLDSREREKLANMLREIVGVTMVITSERSRLAAA